MEIDEKISFVTANFVAEVAGYTLDPDWCKGQFRIGKNATRSLFQSSAFQEEFSDMLQMIFAAGFKTIELWSAHVHPSDPQNRVETAKRILDNHGISVHSYGGGLGKSDQDIANGFRVARMLGAKVLVGGVREELLPATYRLCHKYEIRYGIENHPGVETPEKVLDKIGERNDWFGATIDTGWFATYEIDPVEAIQKIGKSVFHVHLKDIKEPYKHESCTLGDGIVDVKAVLQALKDINYVGYLSIEHEPGDHDPMEDAKESLRRLRRWLRQVNYNT